MTSDAVVVDVSQDWMAACDVQQRFMQGMNRAPEALDYSGRCRQMYALGGDCCDFMPLPGGRLALTIGDASGKGLPASLMISSVLSSVRTAALFTPNVLSAALAAVNRQAHASSLPGRYATLFYGVFDLTTRRVRYVNAGHNPPMVARTDGSVDWLEKGGAPVGLFPESRYEEGAAQFHPGDIVIAYTDGVIEAENPAGGPWGVEGIRKVAAKMRGQSAGEIVRAVFASMDEFSKGRQMDDATVAALRIS